MSGVLILSLEKLEESCLHNAALLILSSCFCNRDVDGFVPVYVIAQSIGDGFDFALTKLSIELTTRHIL